MTTHDQHTEATHTPDEVEPPPATTEHLTEQADSSTVGADPSTAQTVGRRGGRWTARRGRGFYDEPTPTVCAALRTVNYSNRIGDRGHRSAGRSDGAFQGGDRIIH
jgi:hypothetical protein